MSSIKLPVSCLEFNLFATLCKQPASQCLRNELACYVCLLPYTVSTPQIEVCFFIYLLLKLNILASKPAEDFVMTEKSYLTLLNLTSAVSKYLVVFNNLIQYMTVVTVINFVIFTSHYTNTTASDFASSHENTSSATSLRRTLTKCSQQCPLYELFIYSFVFCKL